MTVIRAPIFILSSSLLFFAFGCKTPQQKADAANPRTDKSFFLHPVKRSAEYFNGNFRAKPLFGDIDINTLARKYTNIADMVSITNQTIDSATNETRRITIRNRMLNDLLLISDYRYHTFKEQLYRRNNVYNTGIDLASIGLSGAATLLGGPTAQVLSGTDTAVKAAHAKIDEHWLAGKTMIYLITLMDTMKADKLAQITKGMTNNVASYPLQEGVRAVNEYDRSGSLVSAMERLELMVGNEKTKATTNLNAAVENSATRGAAPSVSSQ
jgi:hypothetical protein